MPAAARPELDHGFVSTPQEYLDGRTIIYTRGKGLGGSSILNFSVYLYGSGEDYNRWAEVVGDDSWRWENTQKAFQAMERFDTTGVKGYEYLANPNAKDHGHDGKIEVCLPAVLEDGVATSMDALINNGEKINLDPNSGDPIGISIFPSSNSKDGRTTSATAHLVDGPDNLHIWTDAAMHRLVFEGTKVVGIETADGRKGRQIVIYLHASSWTDQCQVSCNKDVVLCGGAIDTPKMLLVNGIGPAEELQAHGIKVVKDMPGVGKNVGDHVMTFLVVEVDDSHNKKYAFEHDTVLMAEADAMWKKDKTGAFAVHNSSIWGGFLKAPGLEEWPEYKALDPAWQEFLCRDRVPTYELIGNCTLIPPDAVLPEGSSYITGVALLMNPMSKGSVTLASDKAADKPIIDLGFMTHPYDRRAMREAIRLTWTKLYENADMKKYVKKTIFGPESLSDEDIDAFIKVAASTVWHVNGSVVMGKSEDPMACVDTNFCVYGVEGLRVADLSVCPLTPK
ncbi:GMC oxidoreductase [Pleomassaria siparia CBS 279.74]|uniref:GMC oxidoreductase n=1 Tax=Pleomassaria siparia CBS 279.74 TaxID=1314801 RepID=A0A6G1K9L1_9PLEO|nr:GMC oxidoreductase [Pleomassaria siparia CBS 279.74]